MTRHRVMRSRQLFFAAAIPLLLSAPRLSVAQTPAAQTPAAPEDALARVNESIDALTRKVWPSVVQILVTSYGPQQDGTAR